MNLECSVFPGKYSYFRSCTRTILSVRINQETRFFCKKLAVTVSLHKKSNEKDLVLPPRQHKLNYIAQASLYPHIPITAI